MDPEEYKHNDKFDKHSYQKWEQAEHNEETENLYREASLKMLRVLHSALTEANKSQTAYWSVLFAVSHPDCIGHTMSSVAAELGISRASLSSLANRFCEANSLPPSVYMREKSNKK